MELFFINFQSTWFLFSLSILFGLSLIMGVGLYLYCSRKIEKAALPYQCMGLNSDSLVMKKG